MNCQRCGTPLREGEKFCPQCGTPVIVQKQTFVVRRMPVLLIIVLTMGFLISAFIFEDGDANLAVMLSCVPGIILMFLIYRMDRIEPEPVGLILKLFLVGAFIATFLAGTIESFLGMFIDFLFSWDPIVYSFMEAFVLAAATEELVKYQLLKSITWKHPAFNYRFDGVVYSTMLAIGFDIAENLLYLADNALSTAFMRAAFPGHCVFGIYMGYYYGQAKSHELHGDPEGAKKMRRKGLFITILIHGGYDFLCMLGSISDSEFAQIIIGLLLLFVMVALNVTAYKNIKKYAYYDSPV